jgi:hypothetical protein
MNHLEQAKRQIDKAQGVHIEYAPMQAQLAIAHALIALVERLDELTDKGEGRESALKILAWTP